MQADLGTPRCTYRRLKVLIKHLPRESVFKQAIGGDAARWGELEHLLATQIDLLTWLNHNLVQANSKRRLQPPKRLQRPGIEVEQPGTRRFKGRAIPLDQLRKMRDRWRKGGDDD